jgi:predicted dehydrogenase
VIPRLALAGCGRWGEKLCATLAGLANGGRIELVALADPAEGALERARALAPGARALATLEELLQARLGLDGVLVATPTPLHGSHARLALAAGLDVFVEKPLALSLKEARALVALARGRVAMVGHLMRFHPAHARLGALVREGAVGALRGFSSRRVTESRSPEPLWTLLPHDLATMHALDASPVVEIRAAACLGGVRVKLGLASGLAATLFASTHGVTATRYLRATGTDGTVELDELAPGGARLMARRGDGRGTTLALPADPLRLELEHFAACVTERRIPETCFAEALFVVETLERCHRALGGTPSRPELRACP